MITKYRTKK